MHVVINKRSTKAGVGIISQKDMAITQFLFMGLPLLMPDMFGIVGTYEQFDAFNHFWRLIGFLLGTEDRFNCCGETVEETRSRLQSIKEDMLLPAWKEPFPECIPYAITTVRGLWHFDPTLHFGLRLVEKFKLRLSNVFLFRVNDFYVKKNDWITWIPLL